MLNEIEHIGENSKAKSSYYTLPTSMSYVPSEVTVRDAPPHPLLSYQFLVEPVSADGKHFWSCSYKSKSLLERWHSSCPCNKLGSLIGAPFTLLFVWYVMKESKDYGFGKSGIEHSI